MIVRREAILLPWFFAYASLLALQYAVWTERHARFDLLVGILCFLRFAAVIEAYCWIVGCQRVDERRAGLGMLLAGAFTTAAAQVTLLEGASAIEYYRFGRQIANTAATAFCLLAALSLWIRPVYGISRALIQHSVTLALFITAATAVNLTNVLMRPRRAGWETLNLMFWCMAITSAFFWLFGPVLRRKDVLR